MKKNSGSIFKRKDGRWEGRLSVGRNENGYPKTKSVLAKTKRECREKLEALKEAQASKQNSGENSEMNFGEWLDYWYQNLLKPTLGAKTREEYELRIYKHIIPQVGGIPLGKLETSDIQQFCNRLKQSGRLVGAERYGAGLSDRSVRGCYVTCRAALEQAVCERLIARNPALGCRLPPAKKREMSVLEQDEIQRLLIQAKEDGCFELLLLELTTGMRRGELLALRWDDLDFKSGELRVERQVARVDGRLVVSEPKTKASVRTIVLPEALVEILREYKVRTQSQWMFPSPKKDNSPLDPAAVRKKIQKVLERAECRHVRFHDLRHTFVTMSLEYGMDVKTLAAVIGHASVATTLDVYAHVTDGMRAAAAASIDRGIAGKDAVPPSSEPKHERTHTDFVAKKGLRRKPGTGCVSQINDNLWEGRYSPRVAGGKRMTRNVYAHSREECEVMLAEMIEEAKRELGR